MKTIELCVESVLIFAGVFLFIAGLLMENELSMFIGAFMFLFNIYMIVKGIRKLKKRVN